MPHAQKKKKVTPHLRGQKKNKKRFLGKRKKPEPERKKKSLWSQKGEDAKEK